VRQIVYTIRKDFPIIFRPRFLPREDGSAGVIFLTMTLPVRRTAVAPTTDPSSAVEISEARLLEMIASVQAAGEDGGLIGGA
jgi:hypothetical protein